MCTIGHDNHPEQDPIKQRFGGIFTINYRLFRTGLAVLRVDSQIDRLLQEFNAEIAGLRLCDFVRKNLSASCACDSDRDV